MDKTTIIGDINALAREEHRLFRITLDRTATDADRLRLQHVQLMLDRHWDLLRRTRARQEFGLGPDTSEFGGAEFGGAPAVAGQIP